MKSWQNFEFVQLAILPMFLFSTTFYPLSVYPSSLQIVVEFGWPMAPVNRWRG